MLVGEILKELKGSFFGEEKLLNEEYRGISTDSRKDCANKIFVALRGNRFDGHEFVKEAFKKGALLAVVERKIAESCFLVEDTLLCLQEIGKLVRKKLSPTVVGVTGSSGKTTTKEMLKFALSAFRKTEATKGNENNLIGLPLHLANIRSETEIFVAEMGTNAPGEIKRLSEIAQPDVAVITTIGPSHLEGLGSEKGVFEEKISILEGMRGGFLVFPEESPFLSEAKRRAKIKGVELVPVGCSQARVEAEDLSTFCFHIFGEKKTVRAKFFGIHMAKNALSALVVVKLLGLPWKEAAEILANFEPVEKRFRVEKIKGITLIDDTYNANPVSTKAALEFLGSLAGRKIFVFGDMLELGERSKKLHEEVAETARKIGVDLLITYGEESKAAHKKFEDLGGDALHFESHREIVDCLKRILKHGDCLLVKGSRGMRMENIVEGVKIALEADLLA